jgi:hypothetical protein
MIYVKAAASGGVLLAAAVRDGSKKHRPTAPIRPMLQAEASKHTSEAHRS